MSAPKWNQVQRGNAHVSDGAEGYWASFPAGTSAKAVLDDYMATADYSGATAAFTVRAEIDGDVASAEIAAGVDAADESLRDEGYATWPADGYIALRAEGASDERAIRTIRKILEPLGWDCLPSGSVLRCEPR